MDTNLLLIFLTGLTTGGLSCVAVQGGLLASVLSRDEEKYQGSLIKNEKVMKIVVFLTSKLVAYTLLGLLLGWAGSLVSLSPAFRGWLQILIGIYLLGIAGAMLELHPLFRYFIFTPPRFLTRLVKKESQSQSLFAPGLLGALTVFIPCAATQAIEVVALGTGNPLYGATIMFAFTLGTTPTFFLIGFLFSKASERFKSWFDRVVSILLIVLAVLSINGGLGVMGSIYTLQNFWKASTTPVAEASEEGDASVVDGVQEVVIEVDSAGYSPSLVRIKKGVKTKLKLVTNNTQGCARAFTIPSLRIQKILPETGVETIEFTPTKTGPLVFSCSMGMYTGTFQVI